MAQEKNIVNNLVTSDNDFFFEGLFKVLSVTPRESNKDGKTLRWDDVKISNGEESITLSAPYESGGTTLEMKKMYRVVVGVDSFRKAKIKGIFEIKDKN